MFELSEIWGKAQIVMHHGDFAYITWLNGLVLLECLKSFRAAAAPILIDKAATRHLQKAAKPAIPLLQPSIIILCKDITVHPLVTI